MSSSEQYVAYLSDLYATGVIRANTYGQFQDLKRAYRKEKEVSKFQSGDIVSVTGTVLTTYPSGHSNGIKTVVSFGLPDKFSIGVLEEYVELVERPKPVPKLGSVWIRPGFPGQLIFLGETSPGRYGYWNTNNDYKEEARKDSLFVNRLEEVVENG